MNIIVTGATGAIGTALTKELLLQKHRIIAVYRNKTKAESLKSQLQTQLTFDSNNLLLKHLDLNSSQSVTAFVEDLKKEHITIDGLINNAGTTMRHFETTDDGYETTIAVNFLRMAQLINELKPLFTPNASIVNVNSLAKNPKHITKSMFQASESNFRQLKNYAQSKTATTVYSAILAKENAGKLRVNLADPGIVDTDIIRLNRWFDPLADLLFRPFTKSPKKSTIPILNALFSDITGRQFYANKNKAINPKYSNHPLSNWLWEETNKRING